MKQVDGDTVFRLGSVSNFFTVLAFLAEAGGVYWNQPINRFIPELANFVGRTKTKNFDSVRETAWDDITLGALASQVSGLGRDCKIPDLCSEMRINSSTDGALGEITQTEKAPEPWRAGLSALSEALKPSCDAWPFAPGNVMTLLIFTLLAVT